mmetsp:Transcript_4129/g.7325  ORF Transcript_4129/g.7325 Transcript_4129/m.7325 type:complete len:206 (-) Transcript_4129:467-1084(-)
MLPRLQYHNFLPCRLSQEWFEQLEQTVEPLRRIDNQCFVRPPGIVGRHHVYEIFAKSNILLILHAPKRKPTHIQHIRHNPLRWTILQNIPAILNNINVMVQQIINRRIIPPHQLKVQHGRPLHENDISLRIMPREVMRRHGLANIKLRMGAAQNGVHIVLFPPCNVAFKGFLGPFAVALLHIEEAGGYSIGVLGTAVVGFGGGEC